MSSHLEDPWRPLRRWTSARIALGRAGGSLPTQELLAFRLDHARAVDSVHRAFDADTLSDKLRAMGFEVMLLATAATDTDTFLQRPDLGRRLSEESRRCLERWTASVPRCDLVIIISDGLSALAVERQVPALLQQLLPPLKADWQLAPLMVARRGRVALQDEIGQVAGATIALMLIGERPGLNSPDSLGAYLVHGPKPGNTDANRNCISNIRPEGLKPADAAVKIHYLISESRRRQLSGVELKDESIPRGMISVRGT
jgi:ethanolamine ammonia-lyase small subunit